MKKSDVRIQMWVYIVLLFSLACLFTSCGPAPQPTASQLGNPEEQLLVNIQSDPPNAHIYGLLSDQIGGYIGDTPLDLFYIAKGGAWSRRAAYCRNCGDVPADQTLELISPGEQPHRDQAIWPKYNYCSVAFKCVVVKEGYKPYIISELIGENRGLSNCNYSNAIKGKKKYYTAILEPIQPTTPPALTPSGAYPQPSQQPQPAQQQQQQQQSAIIPDAEGSFGKIILSCNVENAEVYTDGMFVGNAPATLKLKDGIHIIEVKKVGFKDYRRELRVTGGSEVSLRVELTHK